MSASLRSLRLVGRNVSLRAVASPIRSAAPRAIVPLASSSRNFSVSRSVFGSGEIDQALSSKLQEELSYEKESASTEDPPFLQSLKSEGIWTIEDKPGQDEVSLVRQFGNENIRLVFSIADIDSTQDDPNFEAEEGQEAEEAETPTSYPVRASITVTKPGQGALTIDALTQEGSFVVDNISFYSDAKLATDVTAEADWKRRGLYIGPQFDHLDVSVQELFEQYLEERGVTANLALFIPEYAEYKEQKEYVKWLGSVKSFIDV